MMIIKRSTYWRGPISAVWCIAIVWQPQSYSMTEHNRKTRFGNIKSVWNGQRTVLKRINSDKEDGKCSSINFSTPSFAFLTLPALTCPGEVITCISIYNLHICIIFIMLYICSAYAPYSPFASFSQYVPCLSYAPSSSYAPYSTFVSFAQFSLIQNSPQPTKRFGHRRGVRVASASIFLQLLWRDWSIVIS